MKVFSLKKYMEWNDGKATEWAKECDGQPVVCGYVRGKDGHLYLCDTNEWREETPYGKVIFNEKATVLIKDGKKYVSKCMDSDTYDKEKGLLLCLAKANGISYRDLQEMIEGAKDCNAEKVKEFAGKPATGFVEAVKAFKKSFSGEKADDKAEVREVKRHAKVGEYIKIVRPERTFGYYGKGSVFKVVSVRVCGDVEVEKYKKDCVTYIYAREYVVLENYTPYKITLSDFWASEKSMAIHCQTEGEAKELLEAFDKAGKLWCSRDRYTGGTNWERHEEKTVYTNDNRYGNINGDWVKIYKTTIYEFNEVDLSK